MTTMRCRYCPIQVTWSLGRPFEIFDTALGEPTYQPHQCDGYKKHREEQEALQAKAILIDREQRGYL